MHLPRTSSRVRVFAFLHGATLVQPLENPVILKAHLQADRTGKAEIAGEGRSTGRSAACAAGRLEARLDCKCKAHLQVISMTARQGKISGHETARHGAEVRIYSMLD
jgi:hypothetical protein